MAARVFVGMSGGVDSSVTAALLVEQGYDVTGVYMKNWSQDLPGMKCPWAEDLADAKRVAVQLGIDFEVFDFEEEYRHKVVDYMIEEYRLGRTPNPDIMCNQEVKFRLFLDTALESGADMIATGHYARVSPSRHPVRWPADNPGSRPDVSPRHSGLDPESSENKSKLLLAVDTNKDQTYFLYRVTSEALAKTLFPLGDYTKNEVRELAKERGLWTASKKESMGVCFVGNVGMREFLSQYVETVPGDIVDKQSGAVLGRHDGAIFYTLGQRHGLDVGGGLPYYVVGKDMEHNIVYVSTKLDDDELWKHEVELSALHWIGGTPPDGTYRVRTRHRAPLVTAELRGTTVHLAEPQRAVTPGQSIVLYDDEAVLGGGIVQ